MNMRLKLSTGLAVVCGVIVTVWHFAAVGDTGGTPPLDGEMIQFSLATPPVPAPEIGFTDAQNAKLDFSAFKGKVTLVNMWATWCVPCVREMPTLETLKETHDSDKFAVVTISEDRGGAKVVDEFFDQHGLGKLTRYLDPKSEIGRGLKLRGLPTTILLDAEGRELGRFEGGANWASPEAVALIDWYVKQGDKTPDHS
ncbi:MAG TPA: TlpA disulfide reductase family protein [Aliidongia sp.]|nr:TlpA disulfide reductase family protein [Aliidongia sp.]